jgi:glycosyltransferase involved in cell wall biosynthesis
MKVLVAHSMADALSGAELAIADMVRKRSASIEYTMLTPGVGQLASYYEQSGFPVWARKLQTRRRKYPGLHSMQSGFFALRFREERFDAVLCNTFGAAGRVGTACRLAGIPYAIYVREYVRKTRLHQRILNSANRVFAVSQDVAAFLSDVVPKTRLRVVPDHIDIDPLRKRLSQHRGSGKRALPYGSETRVVGYVGRITRYKQPDLFVRSIPNIISRVPNARFVIVGSASDAEKEFESSLLAQISECGLGEYVRLLGQRSDTIEIMSELAACCIPSVREPFPRVVLEAQLSKCPVVASNSGGCPEMIEDRETGFLFSANAPDGHLQLAERVYEILEQPKEKDRMVSNAYDRLMRTFASDQPVRALESEFLDMICNP